MIGDETSIPAVRTIGQANAVPEEPTGKSAHELTRALETLPSSAVLVRLRRQQRVPLAGAATFTYIVRHGVVALDTVLTDSQRKILMIYYPGDIIHRMAIPPLSRIALTALSQTELQRFPDSEISRLRAQSPGLDQALERQTLSQAARQTLHLARISGLSGDQRLASLLIEIALRLGERLPAGIAFDLPMSRTDMADYLSLNPDTLSRFMARFKVLGLLTMTSRHRMVVLDWPALTRLCPFTPAVACLNDDQDAAVTNIAVL